MATANDILKKAAGEIGYIALNDPEQGSKYGRAYAEMVGDSYFAGPSKSVPWCAMFVSWVFNQCGQSMPGLPTASCSVIRNANRGTAREVSKTSAKPGDIVLFDWNPAGGDGPDHVGIVEKNCGSYIQTIEGNTSSGNSGSQSNGGGVYRRTRAWSTVYAVYRPSYSTETPKKSMSGAQIADIPAQAYTGKAVTPNVTSGAGATFSVAYRDNVEVGYGVAVATGTGDWTGSVEKRFKILPVSLLPYSDVEPDAWYVSALDAAVMRGYINGYGDGKLGPMDRTTRGQAVCFLANAEEVDLDSAFTDVVASPYYYEAVQWAEDAGIVNGYEGTFRPDDLCTREEFCVMLYNLHGADGDSKAPEGFKDWDKVSEWAEPAVAWCVSHKIMSGSEGMLRPTDYLLRCEAVAMILSSKKVG